MAQQSAPAAADQLESFALQLVNSPVAKRSELLASRHELITADLRRELIRHGNLLLIDGKYAPAFDIYRLAEQVARQIGDKEGIATAALNIGSVYYFQGNYDLALENYRRAQDLFSSLSNQSEAARSLFGIALTYQAQKKFAEAIAAYEQALKAFETINDQHQIAETLAGIGSIYYEQGNYDAAAKTFLRLAGVRENAESLLRIAEALYRQKDYAQALTYYERSLEHANGEKNSAQTIAALNGAANCYYYQRNYDRALDLYLRSLTISESLNDKSGVATQLQNVGNIYRALGDYTSALQSYFKSLSTAAEATTQATVANTFGGIGIVKSLQGDNAQAIEYFDKSLHAFETNGDVVGMARMLSYIGNAQYVRDEYEQALAAYERSLALYRSRNDSVNQAHVLLGIGAVYVNQQNYVAGLESYQHALAIYEKSGRKTDAADALIRLASACRLQGEYERGLEFANRAVGLMQASDAPALYSLALTEAGRLQRALKRHTEALNSFSEAIKIQQSMRFEPASDFEKPGMSMLPYLEAMELLIDQGNAVEAFMRAEDAKSQTLREIFSRGTFRVTKDMTTSEQQQETRLLGELASLRLQLSEVQEAADKQDARAKVLRDRLLATRAAYESFRKQLYAKHRHLAANRGELARLSLLKMRSLLDRDTAVLEYAVTDDHVFLFVVTREATLNVKAYQLALKPKELTERANASRELYDLLVKPAEPQISTKTKLIVVPDGSVWHISFEALQSSADSHLGDNKTSFSYAISLSALKEMHDRKRMQRLGTTPQQSLPPATPVVLDQSAPLYSFVVLSPDAGRASDERLKLREVVNLKSSAEVVTFEVASFANATSQPGNVFMALSWSWFVAGTPTVVLKLPHSWSITFK